MVPSPAGARAAKRAVGLAALFAPALALAGLLTVGAPLLAQESAPAGGTAITLAIGEVAVRENSGGVALEAEEAPLVEVVQALAERVPLSLVEKGDAVEDPVSLSLQADDWEELIVQLLSRRSYALIWDETSSRPSTLVVFWDAVRLARDSDAADAQDSPDGLEERIRRVAAGYQASDDPAGAAIDGLETKRAKFQEALRAYQSAADPNAPEGLQLARKLAAARGAYREALAKVADYDEARTVAAVLPTFDEDDPKTRRSALETLRWLSLTTQSPEALAAAKASLAAPEDKAEELAALEVLVRYGDEDEVQKLLEPIALQAGPNQERAAKAWIRIRDEQAARQRNAEAQEAESPDAESQDAEAADNMPTDD